MRCRVVVLFTRYILGLGFWTPCGAYNVYARSRKPSSSSDFTYNFAFFGRGEGLYFSLALSSK
jgi:hypothetical protein